MKNRYLFHSKISEAQFRVILRMFCDDRILDEIQEKVGISRPTLTRILRLIRERIVEIGELEAKFSGEVEVDESYFGARRVRGKRGRGAGQKVPVVGLLKRGGKVYTKVVENCSRKELLPVIQGKILSQSTVYTDAWRSYDSLILHGYDHYRIHHHENEFARGKNHINGIESFWSFAKRRLVRANGVRKDKFLLHLKESEFRWNHRKDDMYKALLSELRQRPLNANLY